MLYTQFQAKKFLTTFCGSRNWVNSMMKDYPFRNKTSLYRSAKKSFAQLNNKDWLEAFSHHPEIGNMKSLRKKFSSTKHLAGKEQSGVNKASKETLLQLAELNRAYKKKFGFIFIICASGKTAEQMLDSLEKRIKNDYNDELRIAAKEQEKITLMRMSIEKV